MDITAILCTFDRSESLIKALDSLAVMTLPAATEWEVLIVDNNSRDQTRAVVEAFCHRHPGRFRYLYEPRQGKSYALNTGIQAARGDIVAFVDDDVIVTPTWLSNLTTPLQSTEWSGTGGRILPQPGFSLPPWLAFDGPYGMGHIPCAQFDLGDKPQVLDRPPFGTNMAFRKTMFDKYGGFRTDLGRGAGNLMSNEDTEFGRRLIQAGERLRYVPTALVYHEVPRNRITKDYFLKWWFEYGRCLIREVDSHRNILGIPLKYFSIPSKTFRALLPMAARWLISLNPRRRFYYKCMAWLAAGQIMEMVTALMTSRVHSGFANNRARA
jgi:glycosyltransferase involved in cell wall biosynthesis